MSLDAEAKLAELSERLAQAESAVAAKSENALSALQKENDKLKYQRMCLKRSLEEAERAAPKATLEPLAPFAVDSVHMSNVCTALRAIFNHGIQAAYPGCAVAANLTPSSNRRFGDYQCTSALALPKLLKGQANAPKSPRDAAQAIVDAVNALGSSLIGSLSIAGAGFINIEVAPAVVKQLCATVIKSGVHAPKPAPVKRVVVDFSSPNIAKEMHVGHLRSTIIGECLCRLLEFVGHDVLRINHVGDWGTQFGMLIAHLEDKFPNYDTVSPPIGDLQAFYKQSKTRFDEEPDFKKRAYERVVQLQAGDAKTRKGWTLICDVSRAEFMKIYQRLEVTLTERGESFYQSQMGCVVEDLKKKGLLELEEGRYLMFTDEKHEGVPLTVVKTDGGFTYDTSDMAALKYRLEEDKADWLIYVVDSGQSLHFENVFKCARRAGYYSADKTRVDHVAFGVVLGEDSKKFKTRSGDTVRLVDLLDEALNRADEASRDSGDQGLSDEAHRLAMESVAYGAVKYADLSNTRTQDYKFSFDRMLALKGNTAVYLLYALVRMDSIKRKAGVTEESIVAAVDSLELTHEKEIEVAKQLIRFPEVLESAMADLMPHTICDYLYMLCGAATEFIEACRVIEHVGTPEQKVNMSRVVLCEAAVKVLKAGCQIVGLKPIQRM